MAGASAQTNSYTAVVSEAAVDSSPKALFTAVAELIPDAEMIHEASTGKLMILTSFTILQEELSWALIPVGYDLISLDQN